MSKKLTSTAAPSATVVDPATVAKEREQGQTELTTRLASKLPSEISSLPGASATIDDFLARLKISATTTELSDSGGTALAIELTDFLGLKPRDGYKIQAILRPPELLSELKSELPDDQADAEGERLDDFDDVLVTVSYAPTVKGLGRVDSVLRDAIASNDLDVLRDDFFRLQTQLGEALETIPSALALAAGGDPQHTDLTKLPDGAQAIRILQTAEAFFKADEILRQETSRLLRDSSFFLLADLVANQPQLVLSLSRSIRDPLVGPEETTAKVSYEMGFVNLNGLRRHAEEHCQKLSSELACLDSFLDPGRRSRLEKANRGDRLTFSLEYSRTDGERISVGDVELDLDRRHRWTGALAFGRNLRVENDGTISLRADLSASYEDWSDDPMRQDRGLAKLSFTQRLTDDASLVIGAVWATKPEFRGEVDEEVTARFGFTYALDTKEE